MHFTETWWAWRQWLESNPDWTLFLIFALAALEAVAVIGSIIPAVPIMLALTLFAGNASIPVASVLGAAILGAMLGDGISYAVGYYLKDRAEQVWPFRTHPHWLSASEAFVERHGGKGLIFGRFIGPIRAFVPMAAGIFQMPYKRFLWFNFISAVIWAPPNILPGYIAGAAIDHPYMPGKHQLVFVSVLVVAIATLVWLLPRLGLLTRRWRQNHAPANQGLFRAADGQSHNQVVALALALAGLALFLVIALSLPELQHWDRWAARELRHLRQPSIDYLFLVFSLLADPRALLTLGGMVLAWLGLRGEWRAVRFGLLVGLLCMLLPSLVKLYFAVPRLPLRHGLPAWWSFPSSHAFSVTLLWGFLYMLASRPLSADIKPWALAFALTMIAFTSVSRAFLGLHWSSDVIASLALAMSLLALMRWSWYRGPGLLRVGSWELALVITLALSLNVLLWVWRGWAVALMKYADLPNVF